MQSQVLAADRDLCYDCHTERPESMTKVQQDNPTDRDIVILWGIWAIFVESSALPRIMAGLCLARWAIWGIIAWCIRSDWHSLTHQPEVVGKALMHNLSIRVAHAWSSYKGNHRLHHFLPEAYAVLKLVSLVLPSTRLLHVMPDLYFSAVLAVIVPQWPATLRDWNIFCGTNENSMPRISLAF